MSDTIFDSTVVIEEGNGASASRRSQPAKAAHSERAYEKIVVGTIIGVLHPSEALVDHPYNASGAPLNARTVALLSEKDIGRQAVLGFEEGDVSLPIILGTIKTRETEAKHLTVEADQDRVVLTADREIILRCGEASITLTRAGKVLIRGEYILSRSSGTNCIKGGSVRIN